MKEYYKGKLRRIVAIYSGADAVAERWRYGRRVWPDDSARSNALRLQLPAEGTLEWAYWVHAVDAVRTLGAAEDCYLRLQLGGKYYYLIASPDGSVPLELEGGMAYLPDGQEFPTDALGAQVTAEACIPSRWSGGRTIVWQYRNAPYHQMTEGSVYDTNASRDELPEWISGYANYDKHIHYSRWNELMPIIPDTSFSCLGAKSRKEQNARYLFRVSGLFSGKFYCMRGSFLVGGRGDRSFNASLTEESYSGSRSIWTNSGNVYNAPDVGFKLEMWSAATGGASKKFGVWVVYPAFSRRWELDVVNVNTVG